MTELTYLTARIVGAPDAAYRLPHEDDPLPLTAVRAHLGRCAQCQQDGAVCVVGAELARSVTGTRGGAV